MEIEVNISRPVTLGGLSFIKVSFAILSSKDRDLVDKYKRELSKLLNNLIKALQEKYGKETLLTTNFIVEVEDNTKIPKKVSVKKVILWEPFKIIQENIEVNL